MYTHTYIHTYIHTYSATIYIIMPSTLLSDYSDGDILVRFNASAPLFPAEITSATSIKITCPPSARAGETWGQLVHGTTKWVFSEFRFTYVWPKTESSLSTIPLEGTNVTIQVCLFVCLFVCLYVCLSVCLFV